MGRVASSWVTSAERSLASSPQTCSSAPSSKMRVSAGACSPEEPGRDESAMSQPGLRASPQQCSGGSQSIKGLQPNSRPPPTP